MCSFFKKIALFCCMHLCVYCLGAIKDISSEWDAIIISWDKTIKFSIHVTAKSYSGGIPVSFLRHWNICFSENFSKVEVLIDPNKRISTINEHFLHLEVEKLTFYKSKEFITLVWVPYAYRNFPLKRYKQRTSFVKAINIIPPLLRGKQNLKGVYRIRISCKIKSNHSLNGGSKYVIVL